MAAKTRHRHGLATYRARTARTVAGEGQRARTRKPAKARTRRLPGPTTNAAHRLWTAALGPIGSWPAEARALKDAALADALGRRGFEGSKELWNEYLDANYRRRYRAQQGDRPKRPVKRSAWIIVRRHRRRRPGKR